MIQRWRPGENYSSVNAKADLWASFPPHSLLMLPRWQWSDTVVIGKSPSSLCYSHAKLSLTLTTVQQHLSAPDRAILEWLGSELLGLQPRLVRRRLAWRRSRAIHPGFRISQWHELVPSLRAKGLPGRLRQHDSPRSRYFEAVVGCILEIEVSAELVRLA